jgi:hypothetical protein
VSGLGWQVNPKPDTVTRFANPTAFLPLLDLVSVMRLKKKKEEEEEEEEGIRACNSMLHRCRQLIVPKFAQLLPCTILLQIKSS